MSLRPFIFPALSLLGPGLAAVQAPILVESGRVAADILYVVVVDGRVDYARQEAYRAEPGDRIDGADRNHWLVRGGKAVGAVVGPRRDRFTPFDRVILSGFDPEAADKTSAWKLISGGRELKPQAVWRKSKANEAGRTAAWTFEAPRRHTYYLRFKDLPPAQARLEGPQGLQASLRPGDPLQLSEAVHVTHLGFRPDDPLKLGFLSCWAGTGGALEYSEGTRFSLVEHPAKPATAAFEGRLRLRLAGGAAEDAYKKNYSGAPVYEADFSALRKPGTYRLCVEGVGCSREFDIAADAWARAFKASARGFFHQRSGITLAPPHAALRRPENFSAASGLKLFHSATGIFDTGNGPRDGLEKDNFGNLVKGGTARPLKPVAGGYHDAGDWDRRIQHLDVARALFELYEAVPAFAGSVSLAIPESSNFLPDILDEALFGLDFYRRLQDPDGGVRGGIESSEHPNYGEASWQETLKVYAYAADPWSSYTYAGVAARAARLLKGLRLGREAGTYADSARRAMAWAEARWKSGAAPMEMRDARNLAAAELLALEGLEAWHRIFLETTVFTREVTWPMEWRKHDQEQAAWVYVRLPGAVRDPKIAANARASLLAWADHFEQRTLKTGFGWTQFEYRPFGFGTLSAPDAVPLLRAHVLTGREKYLRAMISACQSGAGANPANLCYTTGLGHAAPRHALHLDSRITGQAAPPGLTLLGPLDPEPMGGTVFEEIFGKFSTPKWRDWPRSEAYYDVFWYPAMNEFTVQLPMARNALVWGYLAGRP